MAEIALPGEALSLRMATEKTRLTVSHKCVAGSFIRINTGGIDYSIATIGGGRSRVEDGYSARIVTIRGIQTSSGELIQALIRGRGGDAIHELLDFLHHQWPVPWPLPDDGDEDEAGDVIHTNELLPWPPSDSPEYGFVLSWNRDPSRLLSHATDDSDPKKPIRIQLQPSFNSGPGRNFNFGVYMYTTKDKGDQDAHTVQHFALRLVKNVSAGTTQLQETDLWYSSENNCAFKEVIDHEFSAQDVSDPKYKEFFWHSDPHVHYDCEEHMLEMRLRSNSGRVLTRLGDSPTSFLGLGPEDVDGVSNEQDVITIYRVNFPCNGTN